VPKKPAPLAKLSRPRLYKAVARERLFRLLDEKRAHPVVWIAGPPGAGKTTLAASYLEEAGLPAIWYQIDSGDSDPATFFYYLKQAIERFAQDHAEALPLFAPEHVKNLGGFARRFFRQSFSLLPEGCILVLDNYHEVAADSALNAALGEALEEIPGNSNLLVMSRSDPPKAVVPSLINQMVTLIDWGQLKLTKEEIAQIAIARGIDVSKILPLLYKQSGGWMAGVTLLLERLQRGDDVRILERAEGLESIFDYFAGLFFDNSSSDVQEVLMKSALLPRISASLAEGMTGNAHAFKYLEDLHKRNLFTDRRSGSGVTYQFHALFRAFLVDKANQSYSGARLRELASKAAALMESEGYREEAFVHYSDARKWDDAERLLLEAAPQLIEQGRWQTLSEHIGNLPPERIEGNHWLKYWLGRSQTFLDLYRARAILESVWQSFEASHDKVGQLLCAATLLEGYFFEFDNIRPMDPWIEKVANLLVEGVRPPSKVDELRVLSSVMMGAAHRSPGHPMLESWGRRVMDLLDEPFDANVKMAAACMLQNYSNIAMDHKAERRAEQVAHSLIGLPQVFTSLAILYWYSEGYTHYIYGRYDNSLACFDKGDQLLRESGSLDPKMALRPFTRGLCERRAGFLDRAEATARRIELAPMPETGHFIGGYKLLKASICFERGQMEEAVAHIRHSFQAFDSAGHFNGTILVGTVAANIAIIAGRFDFAAEVFDRLNREKYGIAADNMLPAVHLNEAWLAHRRGDGAEATRLHLERALRGARDPRARVRFRWYGNAMAELLPLAFAQGIENDVATILIREFDVIPAASEIGDWPWPVKIRCLGKFDVLIGGVSPAYSRKMPRKVLALLKAIIAFGATAVPERKIVDALWPDEEGDAGRRAFTATLHRLRRLLVNPKAIRQSGAELTLVAGIVWVDAQAFETLLSCEGESPSTLDAALSLYHGSFLAQDDAAWIIPTRERLRAKFIQAIASRTTELEASSDHEGAISAYLRGIEADPLVEPFYQGLMRSYEKLGRRTEAASAFRRLRQTLSITLGVQPSPASQRLFESLRSG
jgi:ATP/maltotriose-dependent transcriptional regulator MalT/DNA-binding SARP family transcriptional activator